MRNRSIPEVSLPVAFLLASAFEIAPVARSQPSSPALPKFEVASVKPVTQDWFETSPKRSGGRITWTTDLRHIVEYAYHLQVWRVSGPLPGSDFIYALALSTDPSATDEQVRLMLQSLLADRFKMVSHRVTQEVGGYALIVGKSGLKIKEARAGDPAPPMPEWFQSRRDSASDLEGKAVATGVGRGITAITGRRVSMAKLSDGLQLVLQMNVVDKTGLPGDYYFAIKFTSDAGAADTDAPSLFAAVQDLGLKLEKSKNPVEMLVIDAIEKVPTEN